MLFAWSYKYTYTLRKKDQKEIHINWDYFWVVKLQIDISFILVGADSKLSKTKPQFCTRDQRGTP